jgi:hypothetical protein
MGIIMVETEGNFDAALLNLDPLIVPLQTRASLQPPSVEESLRWLYKLLLPYIISRSLINHLFMNYL